MKPRKPRHSAEEKEESSRRWREVPIEQLIQEQDEEGLRAAAGDPRMNEDLALAFLNRRDLPGAVLEGLAKNGKAMKHRPVIVTLAAHIKTPRHVSLPLIRTLYVFELMQISLTPGVHADIKMAADAAILMRLESISSGERLALAKRGSNRVVAALLLDKEERILEAALHNPFMTEAGIVKAIMNEDAPQEMLQLVCRDRKWSLRTDIRIALLRNEKTPLASVLEFARSLPSVTLKEVLRHSRLTPNVKEYLKRELEARDTFRYFTTKSGNP